MNTPIRHRGLTLVDLATTTVLGRLALGGVPEEMFLLSGRALVMVTAPDGVASVVDVSVADPSNPAETARFPLTGAYRASRLIGSVLCVVTDREVRSFLVGAALTPVDARALPDGTTWAHATDRFVAVTINSPTSVGPASSTGAARGAGTGAGEAAGGRR